MVCGRGESEYGWDIKQQQRPQYVAHCVIYDSMIDIRLPQHSAFFLSTRATTELHTTLLSACLLAFCQLSAFNLECCVCVLITRLMCMTL